MKYLVQMFTFMLIAATAAAQQVADTSYRFNNPNPTYEAGAGPQVCIDEAHHNGHTVEGRGKPFAALLRGDGYRVKGFQSAFTRETLSHCEVLVIANPKEANSENLSYPHPSAFTREEINELVLWIREGGSLFLIVDHAPTPGAASDLGTVLGVHMLDGYARSSSEARVGAVVFGTANEKPWRQFAKVREVPFERFGSILANAGTLAPHPIVKGRNSEEQVDSVVT